MTTFHDWLAAQTKQDNPVGDIARDYSEAVSDEQHAAATDPADLRRIVGEVAGDDSDAYAAVDEVERAWNQRSSAYIPSRPMHTNQASSLYQPTPPRRGWYKEAPDLGHMHTRRLGMDDCGRRAPTNRDS